MKGGRNTEEEKRVEEMKKNLEFIFQHRIEEVRKMDNITRVKRQRRERKERKEDRKKRRKKERKLRKKRKRKIYWNMKICQPARNCFVLHE